MNLEELIASIDIVEYISQYTELEERNGEYWCLSLFQNENTPSFSVRRETNSFYDFSSGIGGNVFTFVKYYNHCSSTEAIKILQKYAGCGEISEKPHDKLAATIICKKFMPLKMPKKNKGIGSIYPDNYMEQYEKRPDKLAVWENEGISKQVLEDYQVYYDSFSNRIVYPIRNLEGKIVNIGGRILDPEWKQKKLRKYTYFSGWNGGINLIYGLYENLNAIVKQHEIIIFEGCKSVLKAATWGICNCGALLTSHLSIEQFKILAKLGCRVVFALDKEINIKNDHNIHRLRGYVNVEYVCDKENLIDMKDSPVDKGEDVFKKLYEQRICYQ